MRRFAIACLLALAYCSSANAQFWACPQVELFHPAPGVSEYECEDCDSGLTVFVVAGSGIHPGDCADFNKTNCFSTSGSGNSRAVSTIKGLPTYHSKLTNIHKSVSVLNQSDMTFLVNGEFRVFRVYMLIHNGTEYSSVGYEVDPSLHSGPVAKSKAKKVATNVYTVALGGIQCRLLCKSGS